MARAMGFYRYPHIERSMGMILKAVGLPPRGRLSRVMARVFWYVRGSGSASSPRNCRQSCVPAAA